MLLSAETTPQCQAVVPAVTFVSLWKRGWEMEPMASHDQASAVPRSCTLSSRFFFFFCQLCGCMLLWLFGGTGARVLHLRRVEMRGQLAGADSLLPSSGFQRSTSGPPFLSLGHVEGCPSPWFFAVMCSCDMPVQGQSSELNVYLAGVRSWSPCPAF